MMLLMSSKMNGPDRLFPYATRPARTMTLAGQSIAAGRAGLDCEADCPARRLIGLGEPRLGMGILIAADASPGRRGGSNRHVADGSLRVGFDLRFAHRRAAPGRNHESRPP